MVDQSALAFHCREFELDLLILFGSHARGVTHSESDVDLAMLRQRGSLTTHQFLDLQARLSRLIWPGEVDLVNLSRASGLLRHIACEQGVLLYEGTPGAFADFRVRAWNQYQDERIQIRRHDSEAIRVALRSLTR